MPRSLVMLTLTSIRMALGGILLRRSRTPLSRYVLLIYGIKVTVKMAHVVE